MTEIERSQIPDNWDDILDVEEEEKQEAGGEADATKEEEEVESESEDDSEDDEKDEEDPNQKLVRLFSDILFGLDKESLPVQGMVLYAGMRDVDGSLDMKKSRWKKLAKFLAEMAKDNRIKRREKKGKVFVDEVNEEHEDYIAAEKRAARAVRLKEAALSEVEVGKLSRCGDQAKRSWQRSKAAARESGAKILQRWLLWRFQHGQRPFRVPVWRRWPADGTRTEQGFRAEPGEIPNGSERCCEPKRHFDECFPYGTERKTRRVRLTCASCDVLH
eukprot:TRINITY_DN5323_c0_g1_i1.p1 TRINITY_DN5323_c0_g1~~TRINITY_DN5323_c0_g1_i1.p1  ORF type:complete len:297 (-),score=85.63 TRINITY_DN5323_c0_g1_i1:123-944(-)